jgi:hypothetical protein
VRKNLLKTQNRLGNAEIGNKSPPNTNSSPKQELPRIGEPLKLFLASNVLSHVASHLLTIGLTAEMNLTDVHDVGNPLGDRPPRLREPESINVPTDEENMENSITLGRSNAKVLHEKTPTMKDTLAQDLKAAKQLRNRETRPRRQSHEGRPQTKVHGTKQARDTTLKAASLLLEKRCKTRGKPLETLKIELINPKSPILGFSPKTRERGDIRRFHLTHPKTSAARQYDMTVDRIQGIRKTDIPSSTRQPVPRTRSRKNQLTRNQNAIVTRIYKSRRTRNKPQIGKPTRNSLRKLTFSHDKHRSQRNSRPQRIKHLRNPRGTWRISMLGIVSGASAHG